MQTCFVYQLRQHNYVLCCSPGSSPALPSGPFLGLREAVRAQALKPTGVARWWPPGCRDPLGLALGFRSEGCVWGKPQTRGILLPAATRGKEHAAGDNGLRSVCTPELTPSNHSLSHRAACNSALISQAAAVWPKRGRVRSRDNREKTDQSLVSVTSFCPSLAGLAGTSVFTQTCG